MGHGHHHEVVPPKELELPRSFVSGCIALIIAGVLAFFGGYAMDPDAAWKGYIIGWWFSLGFALIGPFFVSVNNLATAGWSVSLRRIGESFGTFIYISAILGIIGAFLIPDTIFIWQHPDAIKDAIFAKKAGFLNRQWFIVTTILVYAVWIGVYTIMRRNSLKQDNKENAYDIMYRQQQWSAVYLICFAGGVSFLSWFWLMSLEPNWFSTMFSVYTFAGMFQAGLALMYILTIKLGRQGWFGSFLGGRQVHDMGKLVFGFTVFYAYIGFCQFLLIWYANIPEEDVWYLQRIGDSGWLMFTLALPLLKFIIPFFTMLPQNIKKNKMNVMYYLCFFLIGMQLYEIWYWVAPEPHGLSTVGHHGAGHAHHGPGALATLIQFVTAFGFFGAFGLVAGRSLAAHPLVPTGDPLLHETLPDFTHEAPLIERDPA